MSEYAREHTSERHRSMRAKADRLAHADPHVKTDSSDWTPPEPLGASSQTGMRPVSPRAYKRGGKVAGEYEKARADRKPRAAGGRETANAIANTNDKDANRERAGTKHDGGLKRGGRADGGSSVPTSRFQFNQGPSQMSKAAGLKKGGRARGGEADEGYFSGAGKTAPEHKMIRALKEHGFDHSHINGVLHAHIPYSGPDKGDGGVEKMPIGNSVRKLRDALGYKAGGSVSDGEIQGVRPTGGRMARKSGGHAGKGKMSVNIVIAPGGGSQPAGLAGAAPPMARPPGIPVQVPPPPAAAPTMPMGGMPMGMPMGAGAPPPMGGGMPPPMPRKSGGRLERVAHEMATAGGGGGGEGRLEKIKAYGIKPPR